MTQLQNNILTRPRKTCRYPGGHSVEGRHKHRKHARTKFGMKRRRGCGTWNPVVINRNQGEEMHRQTMSSHTLAEQTAEGLESGGRIKSSSLTLTYQNTKNCSVRACFNILSYKSQEWDHIIR